MTTCGGCRAPIFFADLRYDFYGIGGDPETSIPLKQPLSVALAQALREVMPDFYFGLRVTYVDTDASINRSSGNQPPDAIPPDLNVEYSLITLAPRIQYDTRDAEFYPTDGYLVEGQVALGREWLGSDTEYEKYELAANSYHPVRENGVLGLRAVMQYAGGDAPFFVFPAFGAKVDLPRLPDRHLPGTVTCLRPRPSIGTDLPGGSGPSHLPVSARSMRTSWAGEKRCRPSAAVSAMCWPSRTSLACESITPGGGMISSFTSGSANPSDRRPYRPGKKNRGSA